MDELSPGPAGRDASLPEWLDVRSGILHTDGVSLLELADRFGTPTYVYSARRIVANVDRFQRAFDGLPASFFYAMKANSNATVLQLLRDRGVGAEVVSIGEFRRAVRAGMAGSSIVFSGVGKLPQECLEAASMGLRAAILESLEEAEVLAAAAKGASRQVPVAIRIHPDIRAACHPYLATAASGSKFGMDATAWRRVLSLLRASKSLRLVGLHVHLGSQIGRVEPYLEALSALQAVCEEVRRNGMDVEFLDLGGGFAQPYRTPESGFPLERLGDRLRRLWPAGLRLHLEPGRILVGDAGLLLTRVVVRKRVHGRRFVVVDAGMNTLIRPSLYGATHRVVPVREAEGDAKTCDIVGPICEGSDHLALDYPLGDVARGDLLAVLDTGAYGFSMSSQYNSHPRAAEVMVKDRRPVLIRGRETLRDLVCHEPVSATPSSHGKRGSDDLA